jgi:hypothetical protein
VQLLINLIGIVLAGAAMLLARRCGHRMNTSKGRPADRDRWQGCHRGLLSFAVPGRRFVG